jgi:hypothetical protein
MGTHMKMLKLIFTLLILCFIKLSAQFSLEVFLNDSLVNNIYTIKEKLMDKKIEENNEITINRITYYDWVEPISIKISYLFNKNGKQISRGVSNVKESEVDAQNLFNIALEALTKKYGPSLSNKSIMGSTIYSWGGVNGSLISLSHESKKTRLLMMFLR